MLNNPEYEHLASNESIDFKQYLKPLIKYWYVPLIFFIGSLSVAWYKVKYAIPQYNVRASVQIKDRSTHTYGAPQLMQSMNMFSSLKNIENERAVLSSYPLIEAAIKEFNQPIICKQKGDIRDYEFYKDAPIRLLADSSLFPANVPIHIKTIDNEQFLLSLNFSGGKPYDVLNNKHLDTLLPAVSIVNKPFKYGEKIVLNGIMSFSFELAEPNQTIQKNTELYYILYDIENLTYQARGALQVSVLNEDASILQLSSTGPVAEKQCEFINKLVEVYIRKGLEDKNQQATNTVNFIDMQLGLISDSLRKAEDKLEQFKTGNKMYDVEKVADQVYQKLVDLERQKTQMDMQNKYYEYLMQYVQSDKPFTELVAPSTVNIDDPLLNKLVMELVSLYQEKNTLRYTSSEKSPAYQTLLLRIKSTKDALLENVQNIVSTSNAAVRDLNVRIQKSEQELKTLPGQERDFINIQRKFTLNDGIYTFLLQKRAEASIARASAQNDVIVIDYSRTRDAFKVFPKPNNNYSIALFVALFLSVGFAVVVGVLNDKVGSKEDVTKALSIPIIGTVGYVKDQISQDIHTYLKQGMLTESFRTIRVNLNYLNPNASKLVVGVTSCVSGDGKSFTSLNLAKVQALAGKKVVMVCADMRKPMHNGDFGIEAHEKGLSDYLINQATLTQIALKSGFDGVDIVTAGNVPPNASELLASARMEQFIKELKALYDVIVLDSPPVGLVSDFQSIIPYLDVQLFVVRIGNTPKPMLSVLKNLTSQTQKHTCLVVNGVKEKSTYGGYGYGYGYGVEQKKKWWKKI